MGPPCSPVNTNSLAFPRRGRSASMTSGAGKWSAGSWRSSGRRWCVARSRRVSRLGDPQGGDGRVEVNITPAQRGGFPQRIPVPARVSTSGFHRSGTQASIAANSALDRNTISAWMPEGSPMSWHGLLRRYPARTARVMTWYSSPWALAMVLTEVAVPRLVSLAAWRPTHRRTLSSVTASTGRSPRSGSHVRAARRRYSPRALGAMEVACSK